MPKQVILSWEEYEDMMKAVNLCKNIAHSATTAYEMYQNNLLTNENAKAYLMPILRALEADI